MPIPQSIFVCAQNLSNIHFPLSHVESALINETSTAIATSSATSTTAPFSTFFHTTVPTPFEIETPLGIEPNPSSNLDVYIFNSIPELFTHISKLEVSEIESIYNIQIYPGVYNIDQMIPLPPVAHLQCISRQGKNQKDDLPIIFNFKKKSGFKPPTGSETSIQFVGITFDLECTISFNDAFSGSISFHECIFKGKETLKLSAKSYSVEFSHCTICHFQTFLIVQPLFSNNLTFNCCLVHSCNTAFRILSKSIQNICFEGCTFREIRSSAFFIYAEECPPFPNLRPKYQTIGQFTIRKNQFLSCGAAILSIGFLGILDETTPSFSKPVLFNIESNQFIDCGVALHIEKGSHISTFTNNNIENALHVGFANLESTCLDCVGNTFSKLPLGIQSTGSIWKVFSCKFSQFKAAILLEGEHCSAHVHKCVFSASPSGSAIQIINCVSLKETKPLLNSIITIINCTIDCRNGIRCVATSLKPIRISKNLCTTQMSGIIVQNQCLFPLIIDNNVFSCNSKEKSSIGIELKNSSPYIFRNLFSDFALLAKISGDCSALLIGNSFKSSPVGLDLDGSDKNWSIRLCTNSFESVEKSLYVSSCEWSNHAIIMPQKTVSNQPVPLETVSHKPIPYSKLYSLQSDKVALIMSKIVDYFQGEKHVEYTKLHIP